MRLSKYIIALLLTFSLVVPCFAAGVSTVYRPATIHYNTVTADGLPDNGIAMPSYPNNENKTITINYTADTLGLLVCTSFDAPNIFISNETYMFKLAITCPTPTVVKPDKAHAELYKTINNAPAQNFNWSGRTRIYEEQGVTYDATFDSSQTLTVTLSNIPWSMVKSYATWGMYLPKALLYSSNSAVPVIVNAMYFGAESGFSEDRFAQQVSDSLDDIQSTLQSNGEKIDAVGGKVDQVGNKVDEVGNKIDNLPEKEKNELQGKSDEVNGDADTAADSIPNFSENFSNVLSQFETILSDNSTQTYFDLPNGKFTMMGQEIDIFAGHERVDLTTFLQDENSQELIKISKACSVLACMAVSIFWALKIKELITSVDDITDEMPEIPFIDGGLD